jgi:hypothetical protein
MKKKEIKDFEEVEEIIFEEENSEVKSSFSSGSKKEEKLKEKIKILEKEKNEYLDG